MPKRTTKQPKRPRGRPMALDALKRRDVLTVLSLGLSQNEAARYVGCAPTTIRNTARQDPAFDGRLRSARVAGKVRLLKRIRDADAWQASAWILERMYPDEFGRNRIEVSGPDKGPIPVQPLPVPGARELPGLTREELLRIAAMDQDSTPDTPDKPAAPDKRTRRKKRD